MVDELRLTEYKTKRVAKLLHDLSLEDAPVLIVIDAEEPFVERSARNLPNVSVLRVAGLNVYDVLRHRKLLLTKAAVARDRRAARAAAGGGRLVNLHDVIRRPVVTEKSNIAREERNVVTLAVDPRANKREIRSAVETLFDVKVVDVRTMRMPRKIEARRPVHGPQAGVEEGDRAPGRGPDDRVLRGGLGAAWRSRTTVPRLPDGAA